MDDQGSQPQKQMPVESDHLLRGGIITRSPGIFLVLLGCMGVFAVAGILNLRELGMGDLGGKIDGSNPTLVHYVALIFSFVLAGAGILMVFAQVKQSAGQMGDEPTTLTTSDLEHALGQLGKNYDIQRRQATQGFLFALAMMGLGILVILAGSVGQMFGFTKEGSNLTTVAGIVVEVVSGLGLYLFRETFRQLNLTSDRLHDTWKIFAAFKRAEAIPNEEKRTEIITTLITRLVDPTAASVPPNPPPAPVAGPMLTNKSGKKRGR